MRQLWFAPAVIAALLGCGDSTSPATPGPSGSSVSPDLGTMNVGDVRVLTFAQAKNGLTIPSAESQAVYLVVAANVAGDTGTVPQYTFTGDLFGKTAGVQAARSLATPTLRPTYTRVGGQRGAQFEAMLRGYEHSTLAQRLSAARSVQPGLQPRFLRKDNVPVGDSTMAVGSQFQFNVPGAGDNLCTNYSTVTATIKKVSAHAIIAVDNRTPSGGFTQASYDSLANEFDSYIYPTEVGYFGAPTDIDKNGRVFILFTPSVNQLTPPNTANTLGFVGGFTFAGDLFPNTPESQNGCPESNEGEIFYLMVPDSTPSGGNTFGNTFSTSFIKQQARVTMAHEFQHSIIAGHRIFSNNAVLESAWLDEALSSVAEDAVGRVEFGVSDLQTLTLQTMENMDPDLFSTFFFTNFVRTQSYVQRPDTVGALVTDARVEQDIASFGAGWAFVRYVLDWYSASNPRSLTMALDVGPDSGTVNLTSHAGASLDTLLAHWLVTMYTDNQGIPALPAQYNYRSYNLRTIISALCPVPLNVSNQCPVNSYLPVDTIGAGTQTITLGIPSSSADYFLTEKFTGGARTIMMTNPGSTGGVATIDYPYGRLYVVRIE